MLETRLKRHHAIMNDVWQIFRGVKAADTVLPAWKTLREKVNAAEAEEEETESLANFRSLCMLAATRVCLATPDRKDAAFPRTQREVFACIRDAWEILKRYGSDEEWSERKWKLFSNDCEVFREKYAGTAAKGLEEDIVLAVSWILADEWTAFEKNRASASA